MKYRESVSDFLLALLAASVSSLGALGLQMYVSRNNRKMVYDERRLEALLSVRQDVESACGHWYGWTDSVLSADGADERKRRELDADKATDRAWYSTRVYEMYFPTLKAHGEQMRDQIGRYKSVAHSLVEAGGRFDGDRFTEVYTFDFDVMVEESRKLLGFPRR